MITTCEYRCSTPENLVLVGLQISPIPGRGLTVRGRRDWAGATVEDQAREQMTRRRISLFQLFKYAVYAILMWNGVLYFYDGVNSADFVFHNKLGWHDLFIAYSSVIDTGAWLVLLLVFELETYVLEGKALKGLSGLFINVIVFVSWIIVVGAFYAYVVKLGIPWGFEVYSGVDPCQLVSQGASFANTIDDYTKLTAENCSLLQNGALYNQELNMFASPKTYDNLHRMVWVDIVNAGVWLIVVVLLQLEIVFDSTRHIRTKLFRALKISKYLMYAVLFVCAYYWIRLGDLVAGWDAFVWLAAFFFIENNLMNWEEEVAAEDAGSMS